MPTGQRVPVSRSSRSRSRTWLHGAKIRRAAGRRRSVVVLLRGSRVLPLPTSHDPSQPRARYGSTSSCDAQPGRPRRTFRRLRADAARGATLCRRLGCRRHGRRDRTGDVQLRAGLGRRLVGLVGDQRTAHPPNSWCWTPARSRSHRPRSTRPTRRRSRPTPWPPTRRWTCSGWPNARPWPSPAPLARAVRSARKVRRAAGETAAVHSAGWS